MSFEIVEIASWASSAPNEDRAGAGRSLAWVIDGATDVLPEPLTPGPTDAAWFAETLHNEISSGAGIDGIALREWPAHLASRCARAFQASARQPPQHRHEHPSAAGLFVRLTDLTLDYVSLGDCALMAGRTGHLQLVGVSPEIAGDTWVAGEIRAFRERTPATLQDAAREHLWPKLRASRDNMNRPGGYGVFSITPPPAEFVVSGQLTLEAGDHILLASDGLMRLADVFAQYSAQTLFEAAIERGLEPLLTELRTVERSDPDGFAFPRAKTSDDATGVLLRVTQ